VSAYVRIAKVLSVANVSDDPEVVKLEREAERNRAELSQTVGNLRDKLADTMSPAAIKEEVKDYVHESGEQLIETLRRKAYENPLQAVAVAAGMGYPLWRMLANVPLPVLMVGAGVALTRSGTSAGMNAHSVARQPTDSVQDAVAAASQAATDTTDELASRVTAAAERVRSSAGDAAQTAAEEALKAADRYPLIVGGIGLAIGALVGAAIPRSSTETQLVGELSGEVQERARDMMQSGVEAAQRVASDVYEEAAKEAKAQGLSDLQTDGADQIFGNGHRQEPRSKDEKSSTP
jgi:ElaB/YqjD/DUF883 family membrane-anchored ribosome-binding protein